jgi:hypothetical protein
VHETHIIIDKLQLQHFFMIARAGGIKTMQIDDHGQDLKNCVGSIEPTPAAGPCATKTSHFLALDHASCCG